MATRICHLGWYQIMKIWVSAHGLLDQGAEVKAKEKVTIFDLELSSRSGTVFEDGPISAL